MGFEVWSSYSAGLVKELGFEQIRFDSTLVLDSVRVVSPVQD
jgi:hypothetical protein